MSALDTFLQTGEPLCVAADGQMLTASIAPLPSALLPGSFHPLHRAHRELADVAAEILGCPVAFEMSVVNVDKPALERDEIRRRIAQFDGQSAVWLTRAARFVEKAALFPGAVFVVGADTAARIVATRFYADDAAMIAALERIAAARCRFLVACRVDEMGKCWSAADLPIPPAFRGLFDEIPPERFRWDLSSSALRNPGGGESRS